MDQEVAWKNTSLYTMDHLGYILNETDARDKDLVLLIATSEVRFRNTDEWEVT